MNFQSLEHNDIGLLSELQPTGWPDIIPTIDFYTKAAFCFPIKVTIDKKIVGIGANIIHNNTAWLAHIIVHPQHRTSGIGKLITQTLIDDLKTKNCETIYLIATDLGEPVYTKVGFETEPEYLFFKDIKANQTFTSKNIREYTDKFKSQIANLDRLTSGEDRMFHVEQHLANSYISLQDNIVEGFYLPAFGEGLIIAKTALAGLELMQLRLTAKENAVFPIDNLSAIEFMNKNNYKEFKRAKRMRLGAERIWQPTNIFNRVAGNLG